MWCSYCTRTGRVPGREFRQIPDPGWSVVVLPREINVSIKQSLDVFRLMLLYPNWWQWDSVNSVLLYVQAVNCSMTGLEAFGDDEYTFNQLISIVLAKTCLARVEKRWVDFFVAFRFCIYLGFSVIHELFVDTSHIGFELFSDITLHVCIIINVISISLSIRLLLHLSGLVCWILFHIFSSVCFCPLLLILGGEHQVIGFSIQLYSVRPVSVVW